MINIFSYFMFVPSCLPFYFSLAFNFLAIKLVAFLLCFFIFFFSVAIQIVTCLFYKLVVLFSAVSNWFVDLAY